MVARHGGMDGPAMPRQAIVLAAGRGFHLAPYTDRVPTALITIAERPMVAHSMTILRRLGVTRFILCRGWRREAFDEHLAELGEGVDLVDCPDYDSTGMLETFRIALPHLEAGGFYLLYGDIIFRPTVVRQLQEARGSISIVVNAAAPGNQSKGFRDVEVVTTSGEGLGRAVRRIGKNRGTTEEDIAGEFAGLAKFSEAGREIAHETLRRLYQETGAQCRLPWWLEPIQKASLCDLLQFLVDEGTEIKPAMIFGGWHEVNTPQDLTRAWNDTAMFLSESDVRAQVAAMGACLLSEANDLKRPLPTVAKELNVSLAKLECLLKGDLEVGDALNVLRKMSEVYPVPLNDLWLDADDTIGGVRLFSADAARATARILDRPDRSGTRTPYYEYRDAAMSRCSQFRPEWIKELRVVSSGDPLDPDVQLNNGHLMMQTTLFVGPVDFYYKDRHGTVHRREMNTGDSNFISPFVPHSFTVRNESQAGIIIAVTYGGRVRRAFTEFARVGAERVFSLAGDMRDPVHVRRCVLQRHMEAESLSVEDLTAAVASKVSGERVVELLNGQESTFEELQALADALHVKISDLHVCALEEDEEVVVTRAEASRAAARHMSSYRLLPLARTRHQPDLKTFDLEILDSAAPGEDLRCGLHTFIYHFGSLPVELRWDQVLGKGDTVKVHTATIHPGDSMYVAPLVVHRFAVCTALPAVSDAVNPNGAARGEGRRLLLVRIPGHLTGETLSEFATFAADGRERVGAETMQWYH